MTQPIDRRRMLGLTAAAIATGPTVHANGRFDAAVAQARGLDQLHSLVVLQEGETVVAEGFRGPPLSSAANVKSVSKTLVALLTGIAIDRGALSGPDQPVLPLLGRGPFGDARDALTVGDLLSMRAGLASTSGAAYGAWVSSPDWVAHALEQDLVAAPGTRFIYSTGSWHLLGAALSEATGLSLLEMMRQWIGEPMGISVPPWVADPQGRYLGGNDMALRPADLARIGTMVLDGGRWQGTQIVSQSWLETSLQPRARSP